MKIKMIVMLMLSFVLFASCSSDESLTNNENLESSQISSIEVEFTTTEVATTAEDSINSAIIETGMTNLYKDIFLNLSPKIDKITFEELSKTAKEAEALGYTYDEEVNSDYDYSKINIYDENGDYIFIFTFPNDLGKETLTTLSYNHKKLYSISISDNCHYSEIEYSIHDETREIYNSTESSWSKCELYMFGETSNNSVSETVSSNNSYTISYGDLLDTKINGDTLIIKAKIKPSFSNKATIDQNYHNIEDIIQDQGGDKFSEIQYWAVADMTDGSESKVISFTVSDDVIKQIKNGDIPAISMGSYVDDLYILPSLLE